MSTLPPPLYAVGQVVQVRDNRGRWIDAKIKAIEPHYHYLLEFPPDGPFQGGEIPGLGAVFVEDSGPFAIRSTPPAV